MKKIISITAMVCLVLAGCYSPKKALEQTNKALDRYPTVVAKVARDAFPCVTKSLDSSNFLADRAEQDRVLATLDSALTATWHDNELLTDKLREMGVAVPPVCDTVIQTLQDLASMREEEVAGLKQKVADLRRTINNTRPVERVVQDDAVAFLARDSTAREHEARLRAEATSAAWESQYKELKKSIRGTVAVPWWVFVVIAIILVIIFRNKLKTFIMKIATGKITGLFMFLAMLSMQSCTKFKDDPRQWVFGEGLWIIPLLLFAGFVKFGVDTYRIHKHGSWKIDQSGRITGQEGGKIPIWKIGRAYFAAGFFIAALYIVFNTISNR